MSRELSKEELKEWEEKTSPRYVKECEDFLDWERTVEAQDIQIVETENIRNLLLFNINNNLERIAESLQENVHSIAKNSHRIAEKSHKIAESLYKIEESLYRQTH